MRVPLIVNKKRIASLEVLKENLSISELIEYTKSGRFVKWLESIEEQDLANDIDSLEKDMEISVLAENILTLLDVDNAQQEVLLNDFTGNKILEEIACEKEIADEDFAEIIKVIDEFDINKIIKNEHTSSRIQPVVPSRDELLKLDVAEFFVEICQLREKFSSKRDSIILKLIQHLKPIQCTFNEKIAIKNESSLPKISDSYPLGLVCGGFGGIIGGALKTIAKALICISELDEFRIMFKYILAIDLWFCKDANFSIIKNLRIKYCPHINSTMLTKTLPSISDEFLFRLNVPDNNDELE